MSTEVAAGNHSVVGGQNPQHRKRMRAGSISGRLRTASDLEESGVIDRYQKGYIKDLIISGDAEFEAVLERYEKGDKSALEELIKSGKIGRRQSIDLLDDLDFDFLNALTTDGAAGNPFDFDNDLLFDFNEPTYTLDQQEASAVAQQSAMAARTGAADAALKSGQRGSGSYDGSEVSQAAHGATKHERPRNSSMDSTVSINSALFDNVAPYLLMGSQLSHSQAAGSGAGNVNGGVGDLSVTAGSGASGGAIRRNSKTKVKAQMLAFEQGSGQHQQLSYPYHSNSLPQHHHHPLPSLPTDGIAMGKLPPHPMHPHAYSSTQHMQSAGLGIASNGARNGGRTAGKNDFFAGGAGSGIHAAAAYPQHSAEAGTPSDAAGIWQLPYQFSIGGDPSRYYNAGGDPNYHSFEDSFMDGNLSGTGNKLGAYNNRSLGSAGAQIGVSTVGTSRAGQRAHVGSSGHRSNSPLQSPPSRPAGFIGAYSPEERRRRIEKFLDKRTRRVWTKKVKYDVRKNFADSRVRIKGRFVKKEDEELMKDVASS